MILIFFLLFISIIGIAKAEVYRIKVVVDSHHEGCDNYHGISFDEEIPSGFYNSRKDMLIGTWPIGCQPWSVPQACWSSPNFPPPEKPCRHEFEFTKDLSEGKHYFQYRISMKFPNYCQGTACFQGEACWDAMVFVNDVQVGSATSCSIYQDKDVPSQKVYFEIPPKEPKTPGRFGAEFQGSVLEQVSKGVTDYNIVASPIYVPKKFLVRTLGAWIRMNTWLEVGLYTDDNGKLGSLVPGIRSGMMARLIYVGQDNPKMYAHQSVTLSSPVEIEAGKYWIVTQGNDKRYIVQGKGITVFTDQLKDSLPPNPAIIKQMDGIVSAYIEGEFVQDTEPPTYENISVKLPGVYSKYFISEFNITWRDNSGISKVLLETNITKTAKNYTMVSKGNNLYVLRAIIPSAGTFYWRSIAFDLEGNFMSTEPAIFTVRDIQCSNKNFVCADENTRKYEIWCEGEFSRAVTEKCKSGDVCENGECVKEKISIKEPLLFDCKSCEVGNECECELVSNCNSGLWLIKNQENEPLRFPIISQTPNRVSYIPISAGYVRAIMVCLDPEPTRINKTVISVFEKEQVAEPPHELMPQPIEPSINGERPSMAREKSQCPFECCVNEEEYNDRLCELDKICENRICKPLLQTKDYSYIGITASSIIGILILILVVLPRL